MEPIKVSDLFSKDWLEKLYKRYDDWKSYIKLTGCKEFVYIDIENDLGHGYEYLADSNFVFAVTEKGRIIILSVPGGKYEKIVEKNWYPIDVDLEEVLQATGRFR